MRDTTICIGMVHGNRPVTPPVSDMLRPDQVAGGTVWLDCTDPTQLFKNQGASDPATTNGDDVQAIKNKVGLGVRWVSGGGFSVVKNQVNGKQVMRSTPFNTFVSLNFEPISTFIQPEASTIILALRVDNVTSSSATPNSNFCLIGDSGNHSGMYFANSPARVISFVDDNHNRSAEVAQAQGVYFIVSAKHEAGVLSTRVNGGEWTTFDPATDSANLTRPAQLFDGAKSNGNVMLAHACMYNVAVSDAELSKVEAWLKDQLGL